MSIELPTKCTGCTACMNACPTSSIAMIENEEGFLYPTIDNTTCIECNKCLNTCPLIIPSYNNNSNPICYAAMASDDIRVQSSSGGVFRVLAERVLKNKGVVCGAKFDQDNITLRHSIISDLNKLSELQTSKYVQSQLDHTFEDIKRYLASGAQVLFTGCPCQVAGLKSYLGSDYDNLTTIDLVCHGAPSSKTLKKFADGISEQPITSISFRDKSVHGWTPSMSITFADGKKYYKPSWECSYYKAFLSGLSCRVSCGDCQFNKIPRQGDFTLGDFWGIGDTRPDYDDHKGTSLVLINNEKAEKIWGEIRDLFKKTDVMDVKLAKPKNWNVFGSSRTHNERKRFFKLLKNHTFDEAVSRAFKRWFDVGIVGWWYGKNYGSALTSYALHHVVEDLGYDTIMLEWPYKSKPFPKIPDNDVRRIAKEHYECSIQRTFDEYPDLNNHVETFLVGSDQLWNYYDSRQVGFHYYLDFVRPYRRKISYATSFGHPVYHAPPEVIRIESMLLKDFDNISVREDDGVRICKEIFSVDAQRVVDPVFLCPVDSYKKIMAEPPIKGDFIFAYVLTPTHDIGRWLKETSLKENKPLVTILDRQTEVQTNKEKLGIDDVFEGAQLQDWLSCIYHASIVITDSYHGLCFSLIFNKPVICIINKSRGSSRFHTIAKLFGVHDVIIENIGDADISNAYSINYAEVSQKIEEEAERSRNWLKEALSAPRKCHAPYALSYYETEALHKERGLRRKWNIYANFYLDIVLNNIGSSDVESVLNEHDIHTVALYGNMQPARAVLHLLEKSNSVNIEYMIENECDLPMPHYPRDADKLPKVDAIIITDLQNKDAIAAKIKEKFGYTAVCADELIGWIKTKQNRSD